MKHRTGAVPWIACIWISAISGCARHDGPAPATQPAASSGARDVISHPATASIDDILDNSMEVRLADLKQQVETGSKAEKLKAIERLEEMALHSQGAVGALKYLVANAEGRVSDRAAVALATARPFIWDGTPDEIRSRQGFDLFRPAAGDPIAAVQPRLDEPISVLIEHLSSPEEDVRERAARSLERMESRARAAVSALMNALLDDSSKVRRAALDAVVAIRQIGIPESRKIASGEPARVHEICTDVRTLGIEGVDVAPALIFALGLEDPTARLEAAWTLRYLADPGIAAVRGYFARLTDPTGRSYVPDAITDEPPAYMKLVRAKALDVIRVTRPSDDAQMDMLLTIAADVSDPEAISAAVGAIARDSGKGLEFLKSRMKQENVSEVAVIRGLGAVAQEVPEALDLLIDAADSEKPKVQRTVAAELGTMRRPEDAKRAADALATMATHAKEGDVELQALHSLSQIGPAAADVAPKLKPLINGADAFISREAIYTLSKIAPRTDEAVIAVLHLHGDADDVAGRTRAIEALLTLDPARPSDHLVAALANLLDDPDNALRLRVLDRLTALGKEATPAAGRVARIVDNSSPELRAAAVGALLAMEPDDRTLSAALVAAVRRKDVAAVEKLSPRVGGSEGCRGMTIAKLKQIAERESDQNLQEAARRAIEKISPATTE